MIHELKTDPKPFQFSWDGNKKWEIRNNDRNFQVGDQLNLRETVYSGDDMALGDPLKYTGRRIMCTVNYIMRGPMYGLASGWLVMSVENMVRYKD